MKNLGQMMKQAQEMQSKMSELQDKLTELEVAGSSGAGLVEITMSGKHQVKSLKIDESIVDKDNIEVNKDNIEEKKDSIDKIEIDEIAITKSTEALEVKTNEEVTA